MTIAAARSELVTRAGHARLEAELEHLMTHRRAELERWLRDARDGGGEAGENADLAEALEQQALAERRIAELRHRLAGARIAEPAADGSAGIGARVRLRLPGGRVVAYELVGALEADAAEGRVSVASPVGRALVGRSAGDTVRVATPGGARTFAVLAVEYPPVAVAA